MVVSPSTLAAYLPVGAVPCQSIRCCGPFPSRLPADRVLRTDLLKRRRLFRILFGGSAGRQRIRPTSKPIAGRSSSFGQSSTITVGDVRFSNRPFGVKQFQTIHLCGVDAARGLVLLFGIGTRAVPSWVSRTRWNNLCGGLIVRLTIGPPSCSCASLRSL
jgi:hypothetical protein